VVIIASEKRKAKCLRVLGTPTEEEWPGVTTLPDFKSSFPKWERNFHTPLVDCLDDVGLDLLDGLLVYDPAGRVSAKQACGHEYFKDMNLPTGYVPSSANAVRLNCW
jgi:cyclin-dependent kinase